MMSERGGENSAPLLLGPMEQLFDAAGCRNLTNDQSHRHTDALDAGMAG